MKNHRKNTKTSIKVYSTKSNKFSTIGRRMEKLAVKITESGVMFSKYSKKA